jgi:hypothetical protein
VTSEPEELEEPAVGPTNPPWWILTRRITTFCIGLFCVFYSLFHAGNDVGVLTCGLALIGVLPIENWLSLRR